MKITGKWLTFDKSETKLKEHFGKMYITPDMYSKG